MNRNLSTKILKAIQRGLYEGLSQYDLTMIDDEDSVVVKNNNYKHSSINDDLIELLPEFLNDNKAFKNIVENAILTNVQYTVKDKEELKTLINKSIEVFGNECDLNWIDTSLITDMSDLFFHITNFNGHIENWDVSNVKDMRYMFAGTESFNQDISNWNVSKVEEMYRTFLEAKNFNQDISNWDVSNVKSMEGMFDGATSFNQPIGKWNTSNVTDMKAMFSGVKNFNQDISNWDVSNVEDMSFMFYHATSFNQPIGDWDVSNVTDMYAMFKDAESFNRDISKWNVSNVTDMYEMFSGCPIKKEYEPKFNLNNKILKANQKDLRLFSRCVKTK